MSRLFVFFLGIFPVFLYAQEHSLDYFINQSLQNNPAISNYNNQLLSSRLDSLILRASLKTQLNFIYSNSYAPVIAGYGYDGAITNGANISALLQANRNFISSANAASQLRTIALQNQGLTDTLDIAKHDMRKAITEQYILAFGDQLMMDFNREIYEQLQTEEKALKKLTQANVYKQTDYLSFYTTVQQQQFAWMQSGIQYTSDYLLLSYMAGIVDTAIRRIERPDFNNSATTDFYQSVFYQQFKTDSLRISTEKNLINYQYKPRVGAYADAGYVSTLVETPYRNFGTSIGVSLVVPIYDGHQKKYKLQQVDLKENSRLNNKRFFVNQYHQQQAQLYAQLKATELLVNTINEQIRYMNTLISANRKLLQMGDIRIADYVLALTNYINARNLLNQNEINRMRIINQINYWNQ